MASSPLITIITVTYNADQVIERTLNSVSEQSFDNYEHLIIDGNSRDNTVKVCQKSDNRRLRIYSEPDRGLYDAMNKGIRMANGAYLIFLNAGDTFHSNDTLALYAEGCIQNKDIIYGDTQIVSPEGTVIGMRHLSAPDKLSFKSFSKGMLICHQAFMVKKALVPEYDLRYRFSADYDWCIKCILSSMPDKCMNLRQITIDYLSDGLTDKNKWKSLRERFRIMSRHYGFIPTLFNHASFLIRALRRGSV